MGNADLGRWRSLALRLVPHVIRAAVVLLAVLAGCVGPPRVVRIHPVAHSTWEVRYGPGGVLGALFVRSDDGTCSVLGLTPPKRAELRRFGLDPERCPFA